MSVEVLKYFQSEQDVMYIAGNLFNFAAHVFWIEEGHRDGICQVFF